LSVFIKNIDYLLLITQGSANLHYLSKYYSTQLELDHEILHIK
jgi:hypothetical protein